MSDLLDDHLIEEQQKEYKFSMSFALFWCALFFIGSIWRLMHWPGSILQDCRGWEQRPSGPGRKMSRLTLEQGRGYIPARHVQAAGQKGSRVQ